ncbi:membrane-associated kinase regulator [Spatholobus suberectus]|nr:membrane-associated kinase regulator [Spatholobus suberectus]
MATNMVLGKWNRAEEEEEDEEQEEEALSLCDLPITLDDEPGNQEHSHANEATQEEFDFRSWGAPFSEEPEMCVADEVFFKGQILPLRVSFSSEAGLLATVSQSQQHYGKQFINESRSESLDFRSNNSSRSSSLRSQNSSSSTSSTTTTTKPRGVRNQFHTHPSPKPQLRVSAPTQLSSFGGQGRKSSSSWGIFRLGVVPAPEIGLQDLKVRNRNCVSRNSSSSSNNSAKSVKTSNRNKGNHHNVFKQLVGKGGGLLSGCDCSFETVQSNTVMIKGGAKSTNKTESTTHAVKEKVVELKKQKQRQKQGKKVTSRRRTFEWIKELHASHPDEEALLSNA